MVDINWLVEQGPCKKYKTGDNIPCPGSQDPKQKAMYILLAGQVDVLKKSAAGGTQKVASIIKGDVFGGREYFLSVDDCTYKVSADAIVFVITGDSFNDLSWSRPDILFEILNASYLPPRKPISAAKTIQEKQAAAAQSVPGAAKSSDAAGTKQPAKAAASSSGASPAASLFPEGHKQYPNITKPEYAALVFPKEYTCPFCKKKFKDFRIFRSKLYESSPMRFDLRKYYTDFQTEWYDILVCQNCLFSTFHSYFSDPKPIQKAKIEKVLNDTRSEVILDFNAERDINYVFTAHYLAILCADGYPTMGKQMRAKLWGNLSWLYEDVEDKEMEKFAAEKAAEAYEQVFTESRLNPTQEQITCLSIAGMQYRAGIDRNLRRFLFTAKTMSAGDKTYAKLAEDFMYDHQLNED